MQHNKHMPYRNKIWIPKERFWDLIPFVTNRQHSQNLQLKRRKSGHYSLHHYFCTCLFLSGPLDLHLYFPFFLQRKSSLHFQRTRLNRHYWRQIKNLPRRNDHTLLLCHGDHYMLGIPFPLFILQFLTWHVWTFCPWKMRNFTIRLDDRSKALLFISRREEHIGYWLK